MPPAIDVTAPPRRPAPDPATRRPRRAASRLPRPSRAARKWEEQCRSEQSSPRTPPAGRSTRQSRHERGAPPARRQSQHVRECAACVRSGTQATITSTTEAIWTVVIWHSHESRFSVTSRLLELSTERDDHPSAAPATRVGRATRQVLDPRVRRRVGDADRCRNLLPRQNRDDSDQGYPEGHTRSHLGRRRRSRVCGASADDPNSPHRGAPDSRSCKSPEWSFRGP